jgi:hypothetical protein
MELCFSVSEAVTLFAQRLKVLLSLPADSNFCSFRVLEFSNLKFLRIRYCNVLGVLLTKELYCTPKSQYTTVKHSQQLFEHT